MGIVSHTGIQNASACSSRTTVFGMVDEKSAGWPGLSTFALPPTQWVPRSFAHFAKGRVPRTPVPAKVRHPIPEQRWRVCSESTETGSGSALN